MNIWREFFLVLSIEAALLVGVAAIARCLTRSATWRRTIWQACFVALFLVFLLEVGGARRAAGAIFERRSQSAPPPRHIDSTQAPLSVPRAGVVFPAQDVFVSADTGTYGRPGVLETSWPGVVWLGGVIVFAGLGLGRRALLFAFRRRCELLADTDLLARTESLARQLKVRGRIRVVASTKLVSPITFGTLRPTICLPADFTEAFTPVEQEAVLLHELAHIAARDPLWHAFADAMLALFWWHPLVWWGQRGLRSASEAAADEASTLLANGPKILAECLVNLGTRFTDRAGFKALGVDDVRFRSGLGRRVQRLFALSHRAAPMPAAWTSRLTQFLAPALCVAAVIGCGAYATASTTKGQNMKTWKHSLAGIAALSLLQSVQGEPGEPAAKPNKPATLAAAKPAESPESKTTLPKLSDLSANSKNAQLMRTKLENIVLDQVSFDGLPLSEVVSSLIVESMARDPEKQGVNFIFGKPRFRLAAIDPATGLPARGAPEPFDLSQTTIRIVPPLRNIRLIDLLEVIVRVADHPIEYAIHEYGVVFSEAAPPGANVFPETVVPTAQTFKVDPGTFFSAIKNTFGVSIKTGSADSVRMGLAQFLGTLGVDIHAPNRAVFYNEANGVLLVRATPGEMELIVAAMATLGASVNAGQ